MSDAARVCSNPLCGQPALPGSGALYCTTCNASMTTNKRGDKKKTKLKISETDKSRSTGPVDSGSRGSNETKRLNSNSSIPKKDDNGDASKEKTEPCQERRDSEGACKEGGVVKNAGKNVDASAKVGNEAGKGESQGSGDPLKVLSSSNLKAQKRKGTCTYTYRIIAVCSSNF